MSNKTGEFWYIKINNAQCLTKCEVIDQTKKTVEIKVRKYGPTSRYEIKDIKFIEKTEIGF